MHLNFLLTGWCHSTKILLMSINKAQLPVPSFINWHFYTISHFPCKRSHITNSLKEFPQSSPKSQISNQFCTTNKHGIVSTFGRKLLPPDSNYECGQNRFKQPSVQNGILNRGSNLIGSNLLSVTTASTGLDMDAARCLVISVIRTQN